MSAISSRPTAIPANSAKRQRHLQWFGLLLVVWAGCFWQTLWSMVEIWSRSDTFAHGFLIFPISIFLIWQKRQLLQQIPVTTAPLALIPLFLMVSGWFLGEAVDANVIKQLAVVLILPALVLLCFGWKMLLQLSFPLAYLLFAVPMGEAMVPVLQNITADIVVAALQLTQIPVYREGFYISTPQGNFLVAEACSGIRYLIASVALGTLYAYLTYRSRTKQLIFAFVSVILPIIANGVRAYGIVLIAHFSGMKYAVGVDHLIYGWLFFGLLIFLMFYIGSFWADPKPAMQQQNTATVSGAPLAPACAAVLIMLLPSLSQRLLPPLSTTADFRLAALQDRLSPLPASMETDLPEFSGSSAHVSGRWLKDGKSPVLFYAAFYLHSDNQKLVSWHNQPYQRRLWTPDSARLQPVSVSGYADFTVQETDLRALNGQKRLLWHWYGSGNQFSANPYLITLLQAVGKVLHISQHGSFYALSINYEGSTTQARQQLQQQLYLMLPLIIEANTPEKTTLASCQQADSCEPVKELN